MIQPQSQLPGRYVIRPLEPRHLEWAKAILAHSNLFRSPIWSVLYRDTLTATTYAAYRGATHLVKHQIDSGLSLGVFDTQYLLKRPESVATGGRLYWDLDDLDADGITLVQQMDFPLVSIALAHDATDKLDPMQLGGLLAAMPGLMAVEQALDAAWLREHGPGAPRVQEPSGPGELLRRDATATRHDNEGKGVMKSLAHYMMFKAAREGYREIEIVCSSGAVAHVWSNPPEPFRAEVLCKVDSETYEEQDDEGKTVKPFYPVKRQFVKIRCILR